MAKADYETRVWSIPAWFNSGSYVTDVTPSNSVRRVLRFLNGKKTHNIDLVGDRICWTNCAAQEYYYLFHTEESATQYWNAKFGNCEKQELKHEWFIGSAKPPSGVEALKAAMKIDSCIWSLRCQAEVSQ